MDPACVLAACSPPWSRGFAYEIQRGAKVWGFGLTPSVAVIPPDCGSGKVLMAVVEHSRLPPWGTLLPAPSLGSRGMGMGEPQLMFQGALWHKDHQGGTGTGTIVGTKGHSVRVQARGSSGEWEQRGRVLPGHRQRGEGHLWMGWT